MSGSDTVARPHRELRQVLEEVHQVLRADKVLITDVTPDLQYVLIDTGPPLPSAFAHAMPLSHSICQHTVGMRFPLSIEDAASHPLLRGCLAIPDLDVGAYLGLPFGPHFPSLAMCAICRTPTVWRSEHRDCIGNAIDEVLEDHSDEIGILRRRVRRTASGG